MSTITPAMGWIDDPIEVAKVVSALPTPFFGSVCQDVRGSSETTDLFDWEIEEKVLGRQLKVWNQGSVGSCVSFGWGRAVQSLMLAEIMAGEPEQWPDAEVATEPIYAGSRVEVGGGRISGDGSVGAWAGKWVSEKGGILLRKKYGSYDLAEYSESRCRSWGRDGVPDEIEPEARLHPVKTVSVVLTPEQCADAVVNGHFVAFCGSVGFEMKRSTGGFCRRSGSWAHCQQICGACVVKGGRKALAIRNSWGDYLGDTNNKVTLESGREITLPAGVYLVEYDDLARDLRAGDTFAASAFVGFPKQKFTWAI